MQLRIDKVFLATRTRDTERSMINATTRERRFETRFRIAFWLWVLNRVSKEENTAKLGAIWYAFEPETRFCRDDKHKVVLKRLYNVSQEKNQNPETMENSCGVCDYYHIYFMKYD